MCGARLAERFEALAKIELTKEGGSKRRGLSEEERQAKKLLKKWMVNAGLEVYVDGIGNLFGRLNGEDNTKPIMSGSHIDTVPNGGHFDDTLGILAALEVVEAWKAIGYQPKKHMK